MNEKTQRYLCAPHVSAVQTDKGSWIADITVAETHAVIGLRGRGGSEKEALNDLARTIERELDDLRRAIRVAAHAEETRAEFDLQSIEYASSSTNK